MSLNIEYREAQLAIAIKRAREQRGVSSQELALMLDADHSVVSNMERRRRKVSWPETVRVAELLGLDPIEFFREALSTQVPSDWPHLPAEFYPKSPGSAEEWPFRFPSTKRARGVRGI